MNGTVKFFNEAKGFGFLVSNDDDKEYFVHISGINNNEILQEGQSVSFSIEEGERGPKATNVTVTA